MDKFVFEGNVLNIQRGIYGIFILNDEIEKCAYVGKSEQLSIRVNQHKVNIEKASKKVIETLEKAYLDSNTQIIFRVLAEVPYCFDNYFKDAQRLANAEYFWINYYQNMNQCLEQTPEGRRPSQKAWNKMKQEQEKKK